MVGVGCKVTSRPGQRMGSGLRKEVQETKAGEEIVALSLSSGPVKAGKKLGRSKPRNRTERSKQVCYLAEHI